MLSMEVAQGLLIPFLGTTLGAACVYILKKELKTGVQKGLTGFAAGVMVAAPTIIMNPILPFYTIPLALRTGWISSTRKRISNR